MLGLFAGSQINAASRTLAAKQAELGKLGATASARLDAIERFYTAVYGEADGKVKFSRIWTAEDVRIAEREIQMAMQNGTRFTPSREAPPSRTGIPGFETMTFEQKRAAQSSMNGRK
jgi:hypothetical protein